MQCGTLIQAYARSTDEQIKNGGRVSLDLLVTSNISEEHYYRLPGVNLLMVELKPMYGQDHFDCCHVKQKHYSKLLREKPHLRQSISDIMNGKYSGSDMEMFMYHPYSPKVQRDLRTCHATQVIPLLAIGYKSPTEINPNEGHLTMSYAIDAYTKGQSKLKPW